MFLHCAKQLAQQEAFKLQTKEERIMRIHLYSLGLTLLAIATVTMALH